jgi:cell wall-associated NlpC family hydrolase
MSKNRARIDWNVRIHIMLFVLICFFMARCTAFKKQVRLDSNQPSTTHSSKKNISTKRKAIVQFAEKHVGTRYKYAGKNPKGFDCSGFTHYVMKNFGVELTPVSRYQEGEGKKIQVRDVQPADLLFFRRTKSGTVFHVALVVSNDANGIKMIHSSSSRGVVIDNIENNSYWKTKIATARSVLE